MARVKPPSGGARRQPLVALAAAAALVASIAAFVVQGARVEAVEAARSQFRLAQPGMAAPKAPTIDQATLVGAFAAAPLEAGTVNALLVTSAVAGAPKPAWLALAERYGWRDTVSIQNRIVAALQRQDLGAIIGYTDALMRQNKLAEQAAPLMRLAESDPSTGGRVVALLRTRPVWRQDYLSSGDQMDVPPLLEGRVRTLTALRGAGNRLNRFELAPAANALAQQERFGEAAALLGRTGSSVADPDFRFALRMSERETPVMPFEWKLESGQGYYADIADDGLSGARVSISWDGRAVPVFLYQRTTLMPGRYRVLINSEGDPRDFTRAIKVQLQCPTQTVEAVAPTRQLPKLAVYESAAATPCAYPNLILSGRVQTPRRAIEVALNRISVEPLGE